MTYHIFLDRPAGGTLLTLCFHWLELPTGQHGSTEATIAGGSTWPDILDTIAAKLATVVGGAVTAADLRWPAYQLGKAGDA